MTSAAVNAVDEGCIDPRLLEMTTPAMEPDREPIPNAEQAVTDEVGGHGGDQVQDEPAVLRQPGDGSGDGIPELQHEAPKPPIDGDAPQEQTTLAERPIEAVDIGDTPDMRHGNAQSPEVAQNPTEPMNSVDHDTPDRPHGDNGSTSEMQHAAGSSADGHGGDLVPGPQQSAEHGGAPNLQHTPETPADVRGNNLPAGPSQPIANEGTSGLHHAADNQAGTYGTGLAVGTQQLSGQGSVANGQHASQTQPKVRESSGKNTKSKTTPGVPPTTDPSDTRKPKSKGQKKGMAQAVVDEAEKPFDWEEYHKKGFVPKHESQRTTTKKYPTGTRDNPLPRKILKRSCQLSDEELQFVHDVKTLSYMRGGQYVATKLMKKYNTDEVKHLCRGKLNKSSPFWNIKEGAYIEYGIDPQIVEKLRPQPSEEFKESPDLYKAKTGEPLKRKRTMNPPTRVNGKFAKAGTGEVDNRYANAVGPEAKAYVALHKLGEEPRDLYGKGTKISPAMEKDWKKAREHADGMLFKAQGQVANAKKRWESRKQGSKGKGVEKPKNPKVDRTRVGHRILSNETVDDDDDSTHDNED